MKKISIILAACVAALGFFSSCDGTEDDVMSANVTVLDHNEGKVLLEATLIKDAQLWTVAGGTRENVTTTYQEKLNLLVKNGNTTITGLAEGNYELTVADAKFTNNPSKTITKDFVIAKSAGDIDWSGATNTISENGTYAYKQGDKVGTIVVSNLTVASVTVKLDDYAAVELSDAGASWLKKDGTSSNNAGLNVGPNMTADDAAKILCAKKNGEAKVVSGELTSVKDAEGLVLVKFK